MDTGIQLLTLPFELILIILQNLDWTDVVRVRKVRYYAHTHLYTPTEGGSFPRPPPLGYREK